jgi:phosphoglycerol transferase MdoB-like AlkP superfamily enzyme
MAAGKEALILVESLGLLNNKELQHELLQPLYALAKNQQYAIREGTAPYKYLTQAGEFRELTGYVFHYYQVRDNWVKENSLLIKKQQQGYHVIGVHGNTAKFYRRHIIWPVLGVQEMYFSEEFDKLSMPLCGSNEFRGICDTAVTTWLLANMNKQPARKEFYYWVTLNTHLPLVEILDEGYKSFAAKWKEQGIPEDVLQMAYQHQLLFQDLAGKLSKPGSPKAHILLVGDHAPPFIDPADRKMYDAKLAPYIELIPN